MSRLMRGVLALASVGLVGVADAGAQSLAARVTASRSEAVRLSAPARPGLCGWGEGSVAYGSRPAGNWGASSSRYWDARSACSSGPLRLVLERTDGAITRVRFFIGGQWRADAPGEDVGEVSAEEVVSVLRPLILRGPTRVAKDAMVPLTLIEGIEVAPILLPVVRELERPREVRKQAVFWLSQLAQEVVAPQLDALAREDPDLEIRKQAVFALSQRSNEEAVPALIRIAESKRDPEVRRQAIFWLGQKDDPRVGEWLEKVLARP
jgi:hypothetical protein